MSSFLLHIARYLGLIASIGVVTSCEAIFEEDLSQKEVFLITPLDGIETDLSSHTFWWEPIEGVSGYNLQIVSPRFDSILRLVVDTNIVSEKFYYGLYPGKFQWRVRGYNINSSTDYYFRDLTILNTYDLTDQQVVLKSPSQGFVTSDTSILLEWFSLNNATDYRFELKYSSWEGVYAINPILTDQTFVIITLTEGTYSWGVQGQNQNSSSIFTTRSFLIDKSPPAKPLLTKPVDQQEIFTSQVVFDWSRPDSSGSSIKDSLYFSQDSLFLDPAKTKSFFLDKSTYTSDIITEGKYFWKVRSIDAAGNKSEYSQLKRFYRKSEEQE